jgi:CHAD domain-containing protein
VKETFERELKLEPPDGFVLPELGGEPLPTRVFTSTYHDTPDLVLARNGITLRRRVEEGTGLWQLKLPRGVARVELEQPGPPARPPLEMVSLLVAHLRGRRVEPVARLRTRRVGVRADGVEVVDDSVSILAGQRVTGRFRELELELVDGDDDAALRRLDAELRRAGARSSGDLRPKLFRALDLAGPVTSVTAPAEMAPVDALGLALGEQARRLLRHDPGTRLGSDPEDLHQLRVATRRLRAFLRAGRPLLDRSWSEQLRAELGWLGSSLGPARDLDVLSERLQADVASLGEDGDAAVALLARLAAERADARAAVIRALTSDRYLALLDRLDHVSEPEPASDGAGPPSLTHVFRAEWRRTRKALAGLGRRSSDAELHAARIRVKRARYAAELAEHELGADGARFISRAKALQEILGEHQDATVAEHRLAEWASGGNEGPGVARLIAFERERKAEARAAWPDARRALKRAGKRLE